MVRVFGNKCATLFHCVFALNSCHPTFTDKKVSQPHGCKKIKSFARVSLTKFLVDQIDKNVAMATSK